MAWSVTAMRRLLQEPSEDGSRVAPTTLLDYIIVSVGSLYYLVTLVAVAVVMRNRRYPPFLTRNSPLLAVTALGSALWWAGMAGAYGSFDYPQGTKTFPTCLILSVSQWAGLALLVSASFVRVYRFWNIFVRHSARMLPSAVQLGVVSLPFALPPLSILLGISDQEFNSSTMTCIGGSLLQLVANAYVLLLVFACIPMMWQLRGVRAQFNEYRELRWMISISVLIVALFPVANSLVYERDRMLGRLIVYAINLTGNFILFWVLIYEPFKALLTHDEAYLHKFTFGFSTVPTPAMLREKLENQLTVPELREQFKRFADSRFAAENVAFYGACLDRDEIDDYFQRMAATLAIIETYIAVGSPQQVNISNAARDAIMKDDPARIEIFDDARKDVLEMMELGLRGDFVATDQYQSLEAQAVQEQRELDLLEKMNLKPKEASNLLQVNASTSRVSRSTQGSSSQNMSRNSKSPQLSRDMKRSRDTERRSSTVSPDTPMISAADDADAASAPVLATAVPVVQVDDDDMLDMRVANEMDQSISARRSSSNSERRRRTRSSSNHTSDSRRALMQSEDQDDAAQV